VARRLSEPTTDPSSPTPLETSYASSGIWIPAVVTRGSLCRSVYRFDGLPSTINPGTRSWPTWVVWECQSTQPHIVTLTGAAVLRLTLMNFLSAAFNRHMYQAIPQSEQHQTWEMLHTPQQSTQRQTLNTLPIELQERIVIAVRPSFCSLTPLSEHLV
jgi:hypothetical protein